MNISKVYSWSKWRVFRESTRQLNRHTKLSSKEVRQTYIDFFMHQHGHEFVPSSSIIPSRDQGTYFTNAGMNQFKPIFLGTAPPDSEMSRYRRVVNSQKCVRVGGKHNDLDDVGRDLTHHTFFEMMGNWAFSDYFKSEACSMALTLLTEVFRIPVECLYVTFFGGNTALGLRPDTDTRDVWLALGVPADRVLPFGMKDNFWDMGATGPCGPSTEIHYDHIGHRDAASLVNADSPDVIELWNLVFMQFNRQPDQSLTALPFQHVDTGLGLERLCAVLQGAGRSNYDTDLFTPLFEAIHKASGVPAYQGKTREADSGKVDTAYRIVADHARMFTVAIGDGLLPGIEHLEHKLRQIMYRCIHQAHSVLRLPPAFLPTLVDVVEESLGEAYPEISREAKKIKEIVRLTEEKYLEGLSHGRKTFNKFLRTASVTDYISGYDVLALCEGRHGYPLSLEVISNLAEERGITLDLIALERKRQEDKEMSYRAAIQNRNLPRGQLDQNALQSLKVMGVPDTDDSWKYVYEKVNGKYDFSFSKTSKICALLHDGKFVESVSAGEECGVILDQTNFYSESGGQVADKGEITCKGGELRVTDVQRYQGYVLHSAMVTSGEVHIGDTSSLNISQLHREGCMRNHTATHLVNFAIRHKLRHHGICQSGSLVSPNKLTFDFSYLGAIDNRLIEEIESLVREIIQDNRAVETETMSLSEASALPNVVKLEGQIYPSMVRVVSLRGPSGTAENRSVELCGGVHVEETGDLREFCVTRLINVGLGTKRLTAVTGHHASQAIGNGNAAEEAYSRLEEAVRAKTDLEKWATWEKNLYKHLGKELLQKHRRDSIEDRLRRLGEKISFTLNKSSKTHKRQEFVHKLEKHLMSHYVIHETTPDISLKEMVKCVQSSSISRKLVAVFTRKESKLTCLVSVPQEFKVPTEEICETVVQQFGGRRVPVKGKNCDGFHVVTLNPTQSIEQVSTFVKDLFSKISDNHE